MATTNSSEIDKTECSAIAGAIVLPLAIALALTRPLLSFVLQRQGISPGLCLAARLRAP